jgi:hypothetical protein
MEKGKLKLGCYTSGKWQAVKNSSWSESHIAEFGKRAGYVICTKNKYGELIALASVIGMPFSEQKEIDANAHLISIAPELLAFAEYVAKLELGCAPSAGYMEEIILKARKAINQQLK